VQCIISPANCTSHFYSVNNKFEQEHHLQRALSAQQVYGTAEALVIPIPDMDIVGERYHKLYGSKPDFRAPKQYIHVQRKSDIVTDDVFLLLYSANEGLTYLVMVQSVTHGE